MALPKPSYPGAAFAIDRKSKKEATLNDIIAQNLPGDNAPALTVSEISSALKRTVEDRFGFVRVKGELSGIKRAASGHFYFSLKDADAKLDGVMWKGNAARLAFAPEDGLEVVATGKLTTYAGRSSYQIIADRLEVAGEGALMLLFEKLKARLAAEGLFAPERKRAIPFLPRKIGIVTSPTGAVIRDILHRLADRFPSNVVVWPVLVQGDTAAAQIATAVNGFSTMPPDRRPDLLIVARGGGSIEDLWAFNEEAVVRAVAASAIPVISAVGHETDTTLCDFAADLRAPTPTAAAEMAVPVRLDLAQRLMQSGLRMDNCIRKAVQRAGERLEAQRRLLPKPDVLTAPWQQRADDMAERLKRGLQRRADTARIAFAGSRARLVPALLHRRQESAAQRFATQSRLLGSLHPEAPLKRGFARVSDAAGNSIGNVAAAKAAGQVHIHFADGGVDAAIGTTAPRAKAAAQSTPSTPSKQTDLFGDG